MSQESFFWNLDGCLKMLKADKNTKGLKIVVSLLLLYYLLIKYLTFQCSLCDNSFCQQANLDRHVRKHAEQSTNGGATYKSEHTSDDDEDEDFVELVDL